MTSTAGCFGKFGYPTRAEAAVARSRIRQKPDFRQALNVYHCAGCGRFHLGRNKREGQPKESSRKASDSQYFKERFVRYQRLTSNG